MRAMSTLIAAIAVLIAIAPAAAQQATTTTAPVATLQPGAVTVQPTAPSTVQPGTVTVQTPAGTTAPAGTLPAQTTVPGAVPAPGVAVAPQPTVPGATTPGVVTVAPGTVVLGPTFGFIPFFGAPGLMLPGMGAVATIPTERVAGSVQVEQAPAVTANIPVPGVAQTTPQVCYPGQTQVALEPSTGQPVGQVAGTAPMRTGVIPGNVSRTATVCVPASEAVAGIVQREVTAPEQPTMTQSVPQGALGPGTISMSLRQADVVQALNLIFQGTGASYVLEPGAQGTVNVSLQDVTRDQALEAVLTSANLAYRKVDSIYYIGPRQVAVLPSAPPAATTVTPGAVTAPTTAPAVAAPAAATVGPTIGVIRARYVNPTDIARLFGGVTVPTVTGQPPPPITTPGYQVGQVTAPTIVPTSPFGFPVVVAQGPTGTTTTGVGTATTPATTGTTGTTGAPGMATQ